MADEYIKRSDALQFVFDACTECMEVCEEFDGIYANCHQCMLEVVKLKLRYMPTADVATVIRCKDCSYFHAGQEIYFCRLWGKWGIEPDGFCFRGKKMEKEDDDGNT